jgi:hypothetical protein
MSKDITYKITYDGHCFSVLSSRVTGPNAIEDPQKHQAYIEILKSCSPREGISKEKINGYFSILEDNNDTKELFLYIENNLSSLINDLLSLSLIKSIES